MMRPVGLLAVCTILAACAASSMWPRPELAQRPAPRPGQHEIELLAGIEGTLATGGGAEGRSCLGIIPAHAEAPSFVAIVWPSNARAVRVDGKWGVENGATGQTIAIGDRLRGGGGFAGKFDADSLRSYNRSLTSTLSAGCAANPVFILNRDFAPG